MINTIATDYEKKQILQVKKQALKDMGLESIYQVFWKFKTQEYFNSVNIYLREMYGWEKTFTQYKIIFVKDDFISEIPKTEFVLHKYQLNNEIVKAINKEAIKNYDKTNTKYEEEYNVILNELLNENYEEPNVRSGRLFKYSDSYIDAQKVLSDFLLRIPKI